MEVSGKDLIKILVTRLKDKGQSYKDYDIVHLPRSLTSTQLNQILAFGDVLDWHNERIKEL